MNNPEIIKMQTEREGLVIDNSRLMRGAEFFPEIIAKVDYFFDLIEGSPRLKDEPAIKEIVSTLQESENGFKKTFEMLAAELRKKQERLNVLAGMIPSNNY